jgi:hydroxymethylpyrimidine/phosphomethylpyrimidine kinase
MNVSFQQHPASERTPSVLSIAGSDSGGGAGIQADLRSIAAHGLHGVTALTALTAQNTRAVTAVHTPPEAFLEQQIEALFADFDIVAVKVGMLATAPIIVAVASALQRYAPRHVVLDPVMIASTGARLLTPDAVQALRNELVPRASLITPNLPEAEALLGQSIPSAAHMPEAARALLALGSEAVLLKGGHLSDAELVDIYCDAQSLLTFRHPRLPIEGHGTGCTLSSAIAANLALDFDMASACRRACDYVHGALTHAYRPGLGSVVVLDHFWQHARLG